MSDSLKMLFSKIRNDSLKEIFVTTTSAYIATLPHLMWSFGAVSLYALIANSLVLPLVPWTMLLSFLVIVFSYISPALASVLGYLTTLLCSYSITVAQFVEMLPYASISGSTSFPVMLTLYLIIVFTLYCFIRVKKNETLPTESNEVLSGIISY
jgi:competence protein ComEC